MIFISLHKVLDNFNVLDVFFLMDLRQFGVNFPCDLTWIDRIERILNVYVHFHPIPLVSGPGRTLGGPRADPGPRTPVVPRAGRGWGPGGPERTPGSVKSMLDRGCLNGQGSLHPAI